MAKCVPIVLDVKSRVGIRDALRKLKPPPEDKDWESEIYMALAADLIRPFVPQDALDALDKVARGEQPAAIIEGFPLGNAKDQQAEKVSMALAGLAKLGFNYSRADTSTPHVDIAFRKSDDAMKEVAYDAAIIENPPVPYGHTAESFYQIDAKGNKQLVSGVTPHQHFPVMLIAKHGNPTAVTRVYDKQGEVYAETSLKQGSVLFMGNLAEHMRTVSIAKRNTTVERDAIAIQLAAGQHRGFEQQDLDEARAQFLIPASAITR